MKLAEAFAKGRQEQPKFNTNVEQVLLKMFKKYEREILDGINVHVNREYGRTVDFNDPKHLEIALDEVFGVIAGEMESIMDEVDKDGMIGEWFEDE